MPDFTLSPTPTLGGYAQSFDGVTLAERADLAIVSVAIPLGAGDAVAAAVRKAYGTALPAPGTSVLSADGKTRLIGLGPDQIFAVFAHPTPDANAVVNAALGGAAYTTDQTDVWVALDISGAHARKALARICPIDLDAGAFGPDAAARTSMEHMGALIVRTGDDAFLLCSASSSAASFLHAVETSIENVT